MAGNLPETGGHAVISGMCSSPLRSVGECVGNVGVCARVCACVRVCARLQESRGVISQSGFAARFLHLRNGCVCVWVCVGVSLCFCVCESNSHTMCVCGFVCATAIRTQFVCAASRVLSPHPAHSLSSMRSPLAGAETAGKPLNPLPLSHARALLSLSLPPRLVTQRSKHTTSTHNLPRERTAGRP
jgi:hypothetical protein